jgi:uncharacterized membrane protein YciS (DUF1049 family)
VSIEELIIQWFASLVNFALGFLIGSIITGWFTVKVVMPRVMRNKDVKEFLTLLREVKELLKKILENQKKKDTG